MSPRKIVGIIVAVGGLLLTLIPGGTSLLFRGVGTCFIIFGIGLLVSKRFLPPPLGGQDQVGASKISPLIWGIFAVLTAGVAASAYWFYLDDASGGQDGTPVHVLTVVLISEFICILYIANRSRN